MPTVEKVPVSSVCDADPRALITLGVHPHNREHYTEEGGGQYAALHHSARHCECLGYRPIVSDARRHPFSICHCECFGYRPVVSDARHHPVIDAPCSAASPPPSLLPGVPQTLPAATAAASSSSSSGDAVGGLQDLGGQFREDDVGRASSAVVAAAAAAKAMMQAAGIVNPVYPPLDRNDELTNVEPMVRRPLRLPATDRFILWGALAKTAA
ncbi:unnamed protein product [Schistocephalus solidus]|uniref:Uncharacterized protein n=1 Tax=Schistocephalus solidus TaxID=70667 RepID=A0A183TLB8_SCHSO|nr:unnamed protein product [Schistocephalus solidus]